MDAVPSAAQPPPPPGQTAWPRSAQLATDALLGAAVTLLAAHTYGSLRWGSRPTDLERGTVPEYRIDLNRADEPELGQLPGVGPQLAGRIVAYRREHGGFRRVDELGRVEGVGPATLARLRPWVSAGAEEDGEEAEAPGVSVSSVSPPARQAAASQTRPASARKVANLSGPIDVNRASAEELRGLPGIGPKLSRAIVEERAREPFQSVDDLLRVHGIGAKTLERLRPHVTVGNDPGRLTFAQ